MCFRGEGSAQPPLAALGVRGFLWVFSPSHRRYQTGPGRGSRESAQRGGGTGLRGSDEWAEEAARQLRAGGVRVCGARAGQGRERTRGAPNMHFHSSPGYAAEHCGGMVGWAMAYSPCVIVWMLTWPGASGSIGGMSTQAAASMRPDRVTVSGRISRMASRLLRTPCAGEVCVCEDRRREDGRAA